MSDQYLFHQQSENTAGYVASDAWTFMDQLGQVQFTSKPAVVAQKLREAIIGGVLKPGERLVEQKLAAQFGIGQPTVREALKELENQGMVRRAERRGTYVTELTREEFVHTLEVRLALEVVAVGRVAKRLSSDTAQTLERLVGRMESAVEASDLIAFHTSDLEFHRCIWRESGNKCLISTLETVAYTIFAYELMQHRTGSPEEFLRSADHHRQILDALKSGDPAVAQQVFAQITQAFWSQYHAIDLENPGIESRG